MLRITRLVVVSIIVLLFLASRAHAQTRSTIIGTVTDTSGAILPGATVTLSSPDLVGGARSTVTNASGGYRIADLSPGTYELSVSLDKFRTVSRKDLRLAFGTTLTLDLALPVAAVGESLIVSAAAPVVDVKSAAATGKIDSAQMENLPLLANRRTTYTMYEVVPGAHFRSTFGAAQDANNLTIDGTATTLPQRQGTNPVVANVNWLQEVQVVALGANAEFGEFTGVASNMIVRSGSNRFSGMAEYEFGRPGWLANNTLGLPPALQARFTPPRLITQWDASVQGGGPLMRDKLFLFAGLHYIRSVQQLAGGLSPSDQKWPRSVAKLDWAARPDVRVDGFVAIDRQTSCCGTGANATLETASGGPTNTRTWNARVAWTATNRTLLEFKTGGLDHSQIITPLAPNTRSGPSPQRDRITGISSVAPAQYRDQFGNRATVGFSLTRYMENWVGRSHEIKTGIELELSSFREVSGFPGGRSFTYASAVPETVVLWAGDAAQGDGKRTSLFMQDVWTLTPRFTIQPGVRITFNRGSTPDRGGVFATNPVAPRIGFAWDVFGDHKTVVRAHYGRFHDGLATTLFDFLNTAERTPRITARVLGPDTFQELTRVVPSQAGMDPNIKHSHLDQFTAGVEREFFPRFSVSATYVDRRFDNIFAFIDTASQYAEVQRQDPGPDGRLATADDGGLLTVFNLLNPGAAFIVLSNPDGAYRRYRGLQLVANKRYADNWQMQVGYTFSRTRGSVGNGQGDNVAFGPDTSATGVFVNPNVRINSEGLSIHDFPHQFQAHGSYRVSHLGGFIAGVVYRLQTGGPWGRTATVTGLAQGTATVRVEPRGTRRTPNINTLDLRFEKTFRLGRSAQRREVGVYVDVFNAGNQGVTLQGRVTEASGATLGDPLQFSTPRTVQAAFKVTF